MTTTTAQFDTTPALTTRIRTAFATIGQVIVRAAEMQARVPQIDRLQAKTDAELADIGLTRDQIVRHVYRDLFAF